MKKMISMAMVLAMSVSMLAGCTTAQEEAAAPAADAEVVEEAPAAEAPVVEAIDFPTKDISLIVPFGAGGGTDALARKLAEIIDTQSGISMIVENKTGGSGAVGMAEGAAAKADGHTVTMTTVEAVLLPLAGLASFTTEDFTPITRVNFDAASLIVSADNPANTVQEFVDNTLASGETVSMNVSAFPTNYWLCGAMLNEITGAEFNLVEEPDGASAEIQNLLGGHVDSIVCTIAEVDQYVANGDFKVLATADVTRNPSYPDVPTFIESGYDIEVGTWRGFMVPKDTPAEVVAILEDAFTKAYDSDEFKEFLATMKYGEGFLNSEEFATLLENQNAQYAPVISAFVD